MKSFDSELQYLSELYQRLDRELARANAVGSEDGADTLIGVILENRELFSRIDQMNERVDQIVNEWDKFRGHLTPAARDHTRKIAAAVVAQAGNLTRTLGERCLNVDSKRSRLASELAELSKGSQYLKSVKPVKTNYPKFIDSIG